MTSPDVFFHFFIILVFWVVGGELKGKNWPKMTKKCVSLRISETVPHIIVVFGTHV